MDILIKNIGNLSKECNECLRTYLAMNDGDENLIGSLRVDCKEGSADCPLVTLPEHGDLIDRGLVQEVLAQLLPLVITNELTDKEIGLVHRTVGAIAEMINEQEVVVEASNE